MKTVRFLSGVLIVAILGGCSLVRVGYDQAERISYWWVDSYLDLNRNQAQQFKADLKSLHAWHRQTQLPDYVALLNGIAGRSTGEVSAARVCEDIDDAREKLDILLAQTVPVWAQLFRQLEPSQIRHLRKKFDAEDRQWRDKWLNVSREKIIRQRHDEWISRAESFYGRLTEDQKNYIHQAILRSSWEPQLSWERRQRRQQQTIAVLEKIIRDRSSQQAATTEISALIAQSMMPDDASLATMQRKVIDEACVNLAGLHQLASRSQRLKAQEKINSYAQDFRWLLQAR